MYQYTPHTPPHSGKLPTHTAEDQCMIPDEMHREFKKTDGSEVNTEVTKRDNTKDRTTKYPDVKEIKETRKEIRGRIRVHRDKDTDLLKVYNNMRQETQDTDEEDHNTK